MVADEFRDGNVPAKQDPLGCAQMAFAALPGDLIGAVFPGGLGLSRERVVGLAQGPAAGPGTRRGDRVCRQRGDELRSWRRRCGRWRRRAWKTFGTEDDGTQRQWAEVDFVPGEKSEHKDSQPLRYVGLRLLKPQGVLFADGSDRHYHAVVTNRTLDGGRLLDWHREKAGTVEHVHDEVKNWLGGGHLPSQHFAVQCGVVQAGVADVQPGQRDAGVVFCGGGTDGADEEVSAAAHSPGGADEPEQLRDGTAVVREPGSDCADAEGMGGVRAADTSDGGGGVGAGEGRSRGIGRGDKRGLYRMHHGGSVFRGGGWAVFGGFRRGFWRLVSKADAPAERNSGDFVPRPA